MPKGTIINKETGLRIEGHRTEAHGQKGEFTFKIPGTKFPNVLQEADWTFEAEVPTEPGLYSVRPGSRLRTQRFLLRNTSGEWFWLDFTSSGTAEMLEPATVATVANYSTLTLVLGDEKKS